MSAVYVYFTWECGNSEEGKHSKTAFFNWVLKEVVSIPREIGIEKKEI